MKTSNSKVAVIGLGNIGKVVATNLVKGNREVNIADINPSKAQDLSKELGPLAKSMEIVDAINAAEIVVMAIYFDAIKSFFADHAEALQGKIIIDPSNPIATDENGGFKKIIGQDESAGQILSSLLPQNAKLAKAMGTLGAATLSQAAFQEPQKVLFYATDDQSINAEVESLIKDSGFAPFRVGGLDKSIDIEVFGGLHEYGALGKAVTLEEVPTKA